MGILNQTSFNIVIRNCQKLGKSLLCEKPLGKINIDKTNETETTIEIMRL